MPILQALKGLIDGWLRTITVNDATAGLTITQSGAGGALDINTPGLGNNLIVDAGTNKQAGISFRDRADGAGGEGFIIGHDLTTNGAHNLFFYDLEGAGGNRMLVDSSGNLGVNNDSPVAQLQVNTSAANKTPLIAKLAAAQTADAFQAQNSAGAVLLAVEKDGDLRGAGGFKQPFLFNQDNVAAGQTTVILPLAGAPSNTIVCLPFAGSIVGLSIRSSAARTAGTLSVDVYIGAAAFGDPAILDATNTQSHHKTWAKDAAGAFAAGSSTITVRLTTSADWAPITADIVVALIVEM